MEKLPFTPQGLQDLQARLYALPDAQLQLEAQAAFNDFRSWTTSHFNLTASQVDYLDDVDERLIANAAAKTRYFLENRLPMKLEKQERPGDISVAEEGDRGKLFDVASTGSSSYSEDQGYTTTEELVFSLSYPLTM